MSFERGLGGITPSAELIFSDKREVHSDMITTKSIIVASKNQVHCDLDGEAAILNLNNGIYYGLNPVGAYIWELIQMPISVREIRTAMVEEFEVEPERCEHDLLVLLRELSEQQLIEVRDEQLA
jgi:hypothetical protein